MNSDTTKDERIAAYQARMEAKRERLSAAADKARAGAAGALTAERRIGDAIPFGQPILVGHHSEKRHRRDIERANNLFRKYVELSDKAAEYERRAAGYGASGAISADNPEALDLLRAKLAALEARREVEKHCNSALKRALKAREKAAGEAASDQGHAVHLELVAALDAPDWAKKRLANYAQAFPWLPQFGNNTQTEVRRCQARLKELERREAEGTRPDREGTGWRLVENGDNRIELHFAARQPEAVVTALKGWGFRWTPSKTAWTRQLTHAARHAAEQVIATVERVARETEAARAVSTPVA